MSELHINLDESGSLAGVYQLQSEDLLSLQKAAVFPLNQIQELNGTHEVLARLLAEGIDEGEAGATVGYTANTVSILKASPLFAERLAVEKKRLRANADIRIDRLHSLSLTAIDRIRGRLEDQGLPGTKNITDSNLVKMASFGTDRTGLGPSSTVKVEEKSLSVQRLEIIKQTNVAQEQIIETSEITTTSSCVETPESNPTRELSTSRRVGSPASDAGSPRRQEAGEEISILFGASKNLSTTGDDS